MKQKLAGLLLLLLSLAPLSFGREIVDMMGRHVTVPNTIRRVYLPSPPGAYMMYALAPEMMSGVNMPLRGDEARFLAPSLRHLPALGNLGGGGGMVGNPEAILNSKPDLLIIWNVDRSPFDARTEATLSKIKIPYVVMYGYRLSEYPTAIRFLGRVIGRQQRAEQLAADCERILRATAHAAQSVPPNRRPRVYYAENPNGLSTECSESFHTEPLQVLGDLDVHRCRTHNPMGMEQVSLEQVMLYAPDVILTHDRTFYAKVFHDPAWRQVKAVRAGRVYLIPNLPLNWFDRPPSFMRFLGVEWLANKLYPQAYPIDMAQETRRFYRRFLGITLSDRDLHEILAQ